MRQCVKVVVPDDTRTYKVFGAVPIQGTSAPEDLDPWPGGLAQQYPIALDLGKQMLQAVHADADVSENGLTQSGGVMVNYLYDLDKIEINHEEYFDEGKTSAAKSVLRQLPQD